MNTLIIIYLIFVVLLHLYGFIDYNSDNKRKLIVIKVTHTIFIVIGIMILIHLI